MKSKSIIYLLFLLIFTQSWLQGCTAVSNNINENRDIIIAEKSGSCNLEFIEKGNFVEFKLDDGKTVSGKIVGIKRGDTFYVRDFNSSNYAGQTEIKWDRIISAKKLNVKLSKKSKYLQCGCGIAKF
jgi:hypothetical protein